MAPPRITKKYVQIGVKIVNGVIYTHQIGIWAGFGAN